MDVRAKLMAEEAEQYAAEGDLAFAIWLAENAIEISDVEEIRRASPITFSITEGELNKVIDICRQLITRLNKMIDNFEHLSSEEWLLVISDLSSCYSVARFAGRMPYDTNDLKLDSIVDRLSAVTKEFSLPVFCHQLRQARSRYPNPLPDAVTVS